MNIDLHNHVVPQTVVDALAKHPERYGMGIEEKDGKRWFNSHGRLAELERVVKEYKFKAVEVGTSIEGVALADPRFRKVLKTIEQLDCFLFTHPYQCLAEGGMNEYYLRNFVGFPLDTTLMVAHLMYSGALDELKKLKILLPHGGGYVPYQIGRFIHGFNVRPEPKM
jgi:aminocarboxymuconate-semialdehyde decarboxylase